MILPAGNPPMNNARLERLIRRFGSQVEGGEGAWHFTAHQAKLICLTDERHDRMRIMTPVSSGHDLEPDQFARCLEANFDRTLDARYCLYEGDLWSAFIHPLSDLTDSLFESALQQVAEIAKTFGTTYSSGELLHGMGE